MSRNRLILLQVLGALSILPYPFVVLAVIFAIYAPGQNPMNAFLLALLLPYPLVWAGLDLFAWRAMQRGAVRLAFGLSSIPAAATLLGVGIIVLSWIAFAFGMMGVGPGGLHTQTFDSSGRVTSDTRVSYTHDWSFVMILVVIPVAILFLAAIGIGVMRLRRFHLRPSATAFDSEPGRRPDPDIPPTGYEVSFEDFRRLVSDPYCQPVIAPLLREWYGYEITGQGQETVIRSADGRGVGLRHLHNLIQIDPPKQRTVYNRAMDLWR